MKLNPTSFLGAPAALAASFGQFDIACDHKSIAAMHDDIESRPLAAIDEKYSHFEVSSSWMSPDREGSPESLRQHLGADHFDELARIDSRFAVIFIAALTCKIYRFRGLQMQTSRTLLETPTSSMFVAGTPRQMQTGSSTQ